MLSAEPGAQHRRGERTVGEKRPAGEPARAGWLWGVLNDPGVLGVGVGAADADAIELTVVVICRVEPGTKEAASSAAGEAGGLATVLGEIFSHFPVDVVHSEQGVASGAGAF